MTTDRRRYLEPLGLLAGEAARVGIEAGLGRPFGRDGAFTLARLFERSPASITERLVAAGDPSLDEADLAEAVDRLTLSVPPARLMGIVNVTPDSFSDGGQWFDHERAIAHGLALAEAGAAILDVGGESTRPGAAPVPVGEEIRRIEPVVAALAARGLTVSIDTRNAATMQAALAAGAAIANDVTALRHDSDALGVVAAAGCQVVLMHSRGDPLTMQRDPRYERACLDVFDHLAERIAACEAVGIPRERIILDPGIGFAKTLAHNLDILAHLALYRTLGCEVLLGVSRKMFVARIMGDGPLPASERVPGSIAAALAGAAQGATILRVHDVAATRQALAVQAAIGAA